MKSFFASLYKDICLFLSVSGLLSLLLPALAAAAFFFGLSDSSKADMTVKPFAVALVDLDETEMSETLIDQFSEVELLSEVRVYHRGDFAEADGKTEVRLGADDKLVPSDGMFSDALFSDCAAVITVPLDFFYDAYTGDEGPVHVILNGKMPLESALTENIVGSVMGILKSERAAWYAAYSLKAGGEFDPADFDSFCADSSISIVASALGRKSVLDDRDTTEQMKSSTKNTFFTCACSMLLLFVSAGVLKTLPDERRLGLVDRFVSIGGKPFSLILSKLLAAAVFCAVGIVPVLLILRPEASALTYAAIVCCFFASFAVMLALTRLTRSTEQYMLFGGLITVASLLFGGTIYPSPLLPKFASAIGVITAPRYLLNSFNQNNIFKKSILPLMIIALAGFAVYVGAQLVEAAWSRRMNALKGGDRR
jgi:hypothetical protein